MGLLAGVFYKTYGAYDDDHGNLSNLALISTAGAAIVLAHRVLGFNWISSGLAGCGAALTLDAAIVSVVDWKVRHACEPPLAGPLDCLESQIARLVLGGIVALVTRVARARWRTCALVGYGIFSRSLWGHQREQLSASIRGLRSMVTAKQAQLQTLSTRVGRQLEDAEEVIQALDGNNRYQFEPLVEAVERAKARLDASSPFSVQEYDALITPLTLASNALSPALDTQRDTVDGPWVDRARGQLRAAARSFGQAERAAKQLLWCTRFRMSGDWQYEELAHELDATTRRRKQLIAETQDAKWSALIQGVGEVAAETRRLEGLRQRLNAQINSINWFQMHSEVQDETSLRPQELFWQLKRIALTDRRLHEGCGELWSHTTLEWEALPGEQRSGEIGWWFAKRCSVVYHPDRRTDGDGTHFQEVSALVEQLREQLPDVDRRSIPAGAQDRPSKETASSDEVELEADSLDGVD